MTVYHQMGHDASNLLAEDALSMYRGAILSPVNDTMDKVCQLIRDHQKDDFEMILDPQLYFPKSERGKLSGWDHFPQDVDTADYSSMHWWRMVNDKLCETAAKLDTLSAVCSPAVVPKAFLDEYYDLNIQVANDLQDKLKNSKVQVIQSLVVGLDDLSRSDRAPTIASIASKNGPDRVYLVMLSTQPPRRELEDSQSLMGAMRLIRHLEKAGISVLAGFSSSDLILWKAAGASACATGKYFNLRRFTPSRFSSPQEEKGLGQLPHWFEEALMAFLREGDLIRLRELDLLSQASMANPYALQILDSLDNSPGTPWLGTSWRQFLFWFGDFEQRLSDGTIAPDEILRNAETTWTQLEDDGFLMEDMRNRMTWLRPWRIAVGEWCR